MVVSSKESEPLSREDNWPPPYSLTINRRAKHVRLRICPKKGLQIVIPSLRRRQEAFDFLNSKRSWIEKNLRLIKPDHDDISLPSELKLNSLDQIWPIHYEKMSEVKTARILVRDQELVIFGDISNVELCQKLLNRWIKLRAKKYLIPWFTELALTHGFSFNKVTIKTQQTRWGSCSHTKNINLNYKLLLLPKEYAEYVMLHELCHTIHLDHSDRFWNLLEKHQANCLEIRKKLKSTEEYIPSWLD